MRDLDNNGRRGVEAELIAEREIKIVNENPLIIDQTAALHAMSFLQLQNKMKISEQDTAECFQKCFSITIN